MTSRYKYIIYPGHVYSKHDLDTHYIDAPTLARLYGVDLRECYVFKEHGENRGYAEMLGLPILEPRFDGDYQVANCRKLEDGMKGAV